MKKKKKPIDTATEPINNNTNEAEPSTGIASKIWPPNDIESNSKKPIVPTIATPKKKHRQAVQAVRGSIQQEALSW